jgi:uncharacterized protein YutE (UPF0331/DUF86 family)
MSRINDKIKELEEYLQELLEIIPENFEEYKDSFEKRAACERYFEKIIEAIVDLGFIFIKENNLNPPEDEEGIFKVLFNEEVISERLSEKLKDAKGMRNFIIHQYEKIDDEIVFNVIKEELIKDIEEFINKIKLYIKRTK